MDLDCFYQNLSTLSFKTIVYNNIVSIIIGNNIDIIVISLPYFCTFQKAKRGNRKYKTFANFKFNKKSKKDNSNISMELSIANDKLKFYKIFFGLIKILL